MQDLHSLKPKINSRIYIVDIHKLLVSPAIVREKVIRETSNGTEVSYILNFGVQGQTSISSKILEGKAIVGTPEDAFTILKKHIDALVKTFSDSKLNEVKKIIATAVENGNERFGEELHYDVSHEKTRDAVGALLGQHGVTGYTDVSDPTTSRVSHDIIGEELQQKQQKQKKSKKDEQIAQIFDETDK
jgi:hypothetical protein